MTSVDVSGWAPADEEPLGSKPKQWLRDPDGLLWLWKESTEHHDARHGTFRKGDDWSEFVAGQVGVRLGVPVAHVRLATRGACFGVVSRSVVDEDSETLVHGNELLATIGVGTGDPRDRTGYTAATVRRALAGIGPPAPAHQLTTAFDWFVGYLVLDALIGNTDRHQDNWAAIQSSTERRLAPSFDHASCLGFQLSDAERSERLHGRGNRTLAGYRSGARSKFEGHPSPLEAALAGLALLDSHVRAHWVAGLGQCQRLDDVVADVPEERMSTPAKQFAIGLLDTNHAALSHAIRTMGP